MIAVAMGWQELSKFQFTGLGHLVEGVEGFSGIAHMDFDDTRFTAEHSAQTSLRSDTPEFFVGGAEGAVIGDGDFAHANDLFYKGNVFGNIAQEGRGWDLERSGIDPGADAFLAEAFGFHQEGLQASCDSIGAHTPDHSGDASLKYLAEVYRRGARGRAPFSPCPCNVHLVIDQTRDHLKAGTVNYGKPQVFRHSNIVGDSHDAFPSHEHILMPQGLGAEYFTTFEKQHGQKISSGPNGFI